MSTAMSTTVSTTVSTATTPRRLLPVLLSMALLAPPLLATTAAVAQNAPAAAAPDSHAVTPSPADDGRVAVTRSDGSTGFTRPPGAKDIRRLVNYMRDGMARADKADRDDRADTARQSRKVPYRRDKRSRR